MDKNLTKDVPRYFQPYVNDCFHNAYGAVLQYMGLNPAIILADYLSFMYDRETGNIGVNYFYGPNTSVEFKEENLNTSLEFAYLPATALYSQTVENFREIKSIDRVNINMYICDNPEEAYSRLKLLIDSGKPVVAAVDLYHMRYHRAYMKEHGLHCTVITGYNEQEGWFELFDKYLSSSSNFDGRLPISEVNEGRASENPITWSDGKLKRPVRHLWMEIYAHKDFRVSEEKLWNVIKESCSRMTGEKKVLGYECGVKALDCFISDLLMKKEEGLRAGDMEWFRYYLNINFRNLARNRTRFQVFLKEIEGMFPENLIPELCNYLEDASKHWDISANISLKLGIKGTLDLIGDMVKHLIVVQNLETCLVDKLEEYLLINKV